MRWCRADELREEAKAWALANPNAVQPWDVKGYKLPGFAPQSAEGRHFFMGSWTRLHKRSAGCDLASEAILQVLHHGLERGLDAGIAIETRHFARLAASPEAKAKIRTLFVGTTDAKAMKMRPKDVAPSKPATPRGDRRRRDGPRHRLCRGAGRDAGRSDRRVG